MKMDPYSDPLNPLDKQIYNGNQLFSQEEFTCDVVIIGTGAGGGVAAETLSEAGLNVIILEDGPLKTTKDFKGDEGAAYRELYQEGGTRATSDGAIKILQGRSVGGSTTVNWTSSFSFPEKILEAWSDMTKGITPVRNDLIEHDEWARKRFHIAPWDIPPNQNNALFSQGMEKLGIAYGVLSRNVDNCYNLGRCGHGCPTGAKQSTLVTSIPTALKKGAVLIHHTKAYRLIKEGRQIKGVLAKSARGQTLTIKAREVVLCGGAMNTPALCLASGLAIQGIGARTFLHPVTISASVMTEDVEPYFGAPQSIYSDHFIENAKTDMAPGFKLETPPIHPSILASSLMCHGEDHFRLMKDISKVQAIIALQCDGLHPESTGGSISLGESDRPILHYQLSEYQQRGFKQSMLAMAEIQFAAGAQCVLPLHIDSRATKTWSEAKSMIEGLSMTAHRLGIFSAHVMGGMAMGKVTDGEGRVNGVKGLTVLDGSLFPTSLGVNPMLGIFTLARRGSLGLAKRMQ
jgi:choline dehydrogenase-like flavoprotein